MEATFGESGGQHIYEHCSYIELLMSARQKRPKASRDRDLRILEASTHLFASQGFERTNMSQVARESGVAVGTIYLRYPNKGSLLAGVVQQLESQLADSLTRAAGQEIPWIDRFPLVFGSMMETVSTTPEMGAIMQLAAHAEFKGHSPGSIIRSAIEQIVTRAQSDGAFRPDVLPSVVAAIAYGMVEGAMGHMMQTGTWPQVYVIALADAASRWLLAT